ncbi:serine/threonine-protein kinase [Thermomonospora umbrina]|uniref:Serine/threonine protein kinase n=1 Tax=Thermomonospora umbrina TaxID=111806 RepID=A0A3D9T559_9ACTN|nr:serine/threonine-protein kinase [Thermomonospora umbrina]REE98941.1 serine/threonine protein kinase [Thermomonospora umbrina]
MNQQSGELAHGGRIGPYRALSRLGEGGMGVVYRGTDPAGRDVAVKVLRPEIAADPTARRRLAREVDMMRRVLSPHVADVVDGDAAADPPYVVTRFVPGPSLDRTVAQEGPLTGAALRRVALGLAKALTAVHEAGVVHRDLKPGNVLMVGGAQGEPVVIDFGIAHAVDATRLTRTGTLTGTPGYLAPEVIDEEPATSASDVHAWAATVAFAATGVPPFGQGSLEVVLFNILNGRARLDGVPEPLLPLLGAALRRDPAARPTAAELVDALTVLDLGPEISHPRPEPRDTVTAFAPMTFPGPPGGGPALLVRGEEAPGGLPAHLQGGAPPPAVGQGTARPTRVVPRRRLAVGAAWSRLLAVLAVVLVVAVAIMMPVVGIVVAAAGAFGLRLWDSAALRASSGAAGEAGGRASPVAGDVVRAALRTALTLPYAAAFTVAVTLALASLVAVGVPTATLGACAWGVGAGAAALWTGPGVRAPRRQLERLFGVIAPEPRRIAVVGAALGVVAFVAVIGAVSLTPSFAPMYGLQNSVVSALDRFQSALP